MKTLAELDPASQTFHEDCEDVADQYTSDMDPKFRRSYLLMAAIDHLARTATPEERADMVGAIYDALIFAVH
jgi:hypothetical protein